MIEEKSEASWSPESLMPLVRYLRQLEESAFYGTVSVRFDRGRIVLINVQQALKPETLNQLTSTEEPKPRRPYDNTRNG